MPVTVQRRELIAALGGTVLAWPLVARAQQATKLPTIGFLGPSTLSDANAWVTAFAQRLRELGWIEGRTVAIEYRWADGRDERYAQIAAEFARLKVDVIVTPGGAALTVKQATSRIPIVFTVTSDPLASGLVASLARPGGNATGLSLQTTDTVAKRIELLRELVPGLRRLAVFFNVGSPQPVLEMRQVQKAASLAPNEPISWRLG